MRIVVAMSGGVDSSVAAGLLVEQGHEVIGLHTRQHDASSKTAGRCCGEDDALDARAVADQLGIPFYVVNLKEAFKEAVIDDFVAEFARGRTPNPCVRCNGLLRFRVLLARARALGAAAMATGHYARVVDGRLKTAREVGKDQSYFLWQIPASALPYTQFPLGDMTKDEVRAHAARLGLSVAEKAESQEICFVPDDDHVRVVREGRPDLDASGSIVDESGAVVGKHDAYYRFTVGQRRGIGVGFGKPRYVRSIDPVTGTVVIGDDPLHRGLIASGAKFFERPAKNDLIYARLRHRGALVPCALDGEDPLHVRFLSPARAATPGQSIVFYAGDRATVLGGALVDRSVDPVVEATA